MITSAQRHFPPHFFHNDPSLYSTQLFLLLEEEMACREEEHENTSCLRRSLGTLCTDVMGRVKYGFF